MTADISVVVATHSEGRILLPTLRSVRAAAEIAQERGIRVELVIVADRIDDETRRVLDVHANAETLGDVALQVVEVDNGDLGLSRNDGIAAATAPVIAVLDGDNLISTQWLVNGLDQVRAHGDRAIVHPETIISFGARHTRWHLAPSDAQDFPTGLLAAVNPWDACVIASRTVFETVPYLYLRRRSGTAPKTGPGTSRPWKRGSRTSSPPAPPCSTGSAPDRSSPRTATTSCLRSASSPRSIARMPLCAMRASRLARCRGPVAMCSAKSSPSRSGAPCATPPGERARSPAASPGDSTAPPRRSSSRRPRPSARSGCSTTGKPPTGSNPRCPSRVPTPSRDTRRGVTRGATGTVSGPPRTGRCSVPSAEPPISCSSARGCAPEAATG